MKKTGLFTAFAAASLLGVIFTGCNNTTLPEIQTVRVQKVEIDADLKANAELVEGQVFDISNKFTVTPADATNTAATYNSSATSVATIDGTGKITAVSAGTTTITVMVDAKSDSFTLTVKEPDPDAIRVAEVLLDSSIAEGVALVIDETLDISDKATVLPEDATYPEKSYSSSAPAVATISNEGVIEAVTVGTAQITVTADGKSAAFTVTVVANIIQVESVAWDSDLKAGKTLTIGSTLDVADKVTVTPADATDQNLQFASTETSVATISATGLITAVAPGAATISVTADGKSDSFELTVIRSVALSISNLTIPVGATDRIWDKVDVLPVPSDLKAKNIDFSTSDESVATVDQYGVIIGVGEGNATITVADKDNAAINATMTVNIVTATYYPRNTGEGADEVWTMTTSPAPNSGNGSSLTAALDGIYKSVPETGADETVLILSRAGINATNPMEFVVDMKVSQVVNVFKIIHRASANANRLVRFFGFDEISGSDDGENFTTIATMVEVADAESPLYCSISETTFANNTPYRYIKFTCKTREFCFVHGLTTSVSSQTSTESTYKFPGIRQLLNADRTPNNDVNGGVCQAHYDDQGGSNQIQELYLGKTGN